MNLITCPACNHENESSRVFCHNCGVRLPRTEEQIEEVAKINQEAGEKARLVRQGKFKHKDRKPFDWRELTAGGLVGLFNMAVLGAFLAALILMFRAPAALPKPVTANAELAQAGDDQLRQASQPDYTGNLSATPAQISSYLGAKLTMKAKDLGFGFSEVERSYVVLGDGDFTFGVLYRMFGLPLVLQNEFRLTGESREFGLATVGGSIGRLPVHPLIFSRFLSWYAPVANAMEPQLETLAGAQSISISPAQVEVRWESKSAAAGESASPEPSTLRPSGSGLRSFP
jgi:hypothetical protein